MTVNVPDDVARRLEAAAAARGVTVDEFATGVLIDNVPEVANTTGRRHLAFVGIGASERGISHRIEELLDDGFGRDWVVLIVDTGPLVAAADRSDRHHLACVELLETASGPLVTTAMVIAETAYLLTRELGPGAEPALYDAILDGGLTVEPMTSADWRRIRDLIDA